MTVEDEVLDEWEPSGIDDWWPTVEAKRRLIYDRIAAVVEKLAPYSPTEKLTVFARPPERSLEQFPWAFLDQFQPTNLQPLSFPQNRNGNKAQMWQIIHNVRVNWLAAPRGENLPVAVDDVLELELAFAAVFARNRGLGGLVQSITVIQPLWDGIAYQGQRFIGFQAGLVVDTHIQLPIGV